MNAPTLPQNLKQRALYEDVAELLRQRIFNRTLEPGSWIDELKIAEEYGISRTPLREALKVLATEGLVTMKVRRGAYVTEVNEKDLADVFHLMAVLEADAAGTVARAATDDQGPEGGGADAADSQTPQWSCGIFRATISKAVCEISSGVKGVSRCRDW